jgi:hypothetical protein
MNRGVASLRGIYADGDLVIIRFDAAVTAKDGVLYTNTGYFQIWEANVVKAVAFFDTRDFDDSWMGVKPPE